MRLEYPMQLGSGTFALRPGLTYLGQTERWAWVAEDRRDDPGREERQRLPAGQPVSGGRPHSRGS